MSEAFIREFRDFVDWNVISEFQELSYEFVIEFKDSIDCDAIVF